MCQNDQKTREYKYLIEPFRGKVVAEISKDIKRCKNIFEISLTKKEFGKWYRPIKPIDYIRAKKWVDWNLDHIEKCNKRDV